MCLDTFHVDFDFIPFLESILRISTLIIYILKNQILFFLFIIVNRIIIFTVYFFIIGSLCIF